MSGGTERAVLPEYTALIDTARIAAATEALDAVRHAHQAGVDTEITARSDLDEAAGNWSALRTAPEVTNTTIMRAWRTAEYRKAVVACRRDRVIAASTRLEEAKVAHGKAVGLAHKAMAMAGVAGMLSACRSYDYSQAIFSMPVNDVRELQARRPTFDAAIRLAEDQFRAAAAALAYACRIGGYRDSSIPENWAFHASFPLTETAARMVFRCLPSSGIQHTMSDGERRDLLLRARSGMIDIARRAQEVPGAPEDGIAARTRMLRKRAEATLDAGDMDRIAPLLADIAVHVAGLEELTAEAVALADGLNVASRRSRSGRRCTTWSRRRSFRNATHSVRC